MIALLIIVLHSCPRNSEIIIHGKRWKINARFQRDEKTAQNGTAVGERASPAAAGPDLQCVSSGLCLRRRTRRDSSAHADLSRNEAVPERSCSGTAGIFWFTASGACPPADPVSPVPSKPRAAFSPWRCRAAPPQRRTTGGTCSRKCRRSRRSRGAAPGG